MMQILLRVCLFSILAWLVLGGAVATAQFHDPRALAADPLQDKGPIAPRLKGLGEVTMPVTTRDKGSQYFFDQGLRLTYGFNHSEALRSFKESARLDPDNAMAWWGQALVLGPNINLPMMPYVVQPAVDAAQRAVDLQVNANEKERALIAALQLRYSIASNADQRAMNAAYAKAMAELVASYPDDPNIVTLYASAIMNLSPWDYWYRDGTPYTRTAVVNNLLQTAIEANPEHTGALHYYIHITEAQAPLQAEGAADALDGLAPGAGHLVHMPSHIYMRLGRYADSYRVNRKAAKADASYIASCQAQGLYPIGYYPHNVHFLVWSAQFLGRSDDAMQAARKIRDQIPEFIGVEDQQPQAVPGDAWKLFETFMSQPLFTLARFGMWDEILAEPQPVRPARLMNGIWHYARGLAFANRGGIAAARHELRLLLNILAEPGIHEYPAGINGAGSLLDIAAELLAGEIEAAVENYPLAIAHLGRAVRLQDGMIYNEPPDWFFPSRHYLGAALLDAGLPAEAETVYWDDLRRMPNNGFALFGLWQAQLAQDKLLKAQETLEKFNDIWADADVELTSSRY
jgi:hypothetical protein